MPANRERDAFEYATRLCDRLPRCLQDCREGVKLSRYGLEKACGVSRDMLGRVESRTYIPTVFLLAQIAHGMGMTLGQFVQKWEEGDEQVLSRLRAEGNPSEMSD